MVPNPTRISRPNRIPAALAAVIAIWSCAPVALGDARADYASLFGEEEKKVLATAFTKDDATFAAKLLARAGDLKDAPELQRLVLTRAVELGQKDADGLATAIDAAKQIIATAQGTEKLDWRGKLVDLYAAQYKRATGTKRAEAGEFLLNILQKEADDLTAESKYADAVKRLNEARDIARSIRSPRVDDFLSAAKDVQTRQQTAEKYDRLRQKLEQQGGDTAMLEQVILGYLLEVGDAETAKKLAAGHPDKTWEKMIGLSATAGKATEPALLLEVADWYGKVGERLSGSGAAAIALGRAQGLFRQFSHAYQKKDALGLRAQDGLDRVTRALAQASPGATTADRIVIWNQHNNVSNDRGTRTLNVALLLKGKTVWRQSRLAIEWKANQDISLTIQLPTILFDRVRVEVVEWHGIGGGLSEIEVFAGTQNIAKGGAVTASGYVRSTVPGTQDLFQPAFLTDGTTTSGASYKGYWCLPNNTAGWAEIELPAIRR